jgi:hypothetical protein
MAALENIVAWCKEERIRLLDQIAQLEAGTLRTYEKHVHPPGWIEIDTTEQSIDLYKHYIGELSAFISHFPAITPTVPVEPTPVRRFHLPFSAKREAPTPELRVDTSEVHPDWVNGWGVVKGQPPRWLFVGIYASHAEANEAAANAGDGYYTRWGSYNEGRKQFSSGPAFMKP